MPPDAESGSDDALDSLSDNSSLASLLKAAAALFAAVGLGVAAWLVDKAVRYPEVRASQFGNEAPLWIPFALFVLLCVGLVAYVFLKAARRVEAGEDLFSQRHRRRPGKAAEDERA